METKEWRGRILDLQNRKIFKGRVVVEGNRISAIIPDESVTENHLIAPGFVDAHVHIESSMVTPYAFSKAAVKHGTVATVSDPHEIANVLGVQGVEFMIENAALAPLKIFFGAPSCVPATNFETAGASLDAKDIRYLLKDKGLLYLSEMMNYPGVIYRDPAVLEKIAVALELGKPIDGHAPGLRGDDLKAYFNEKITTDHECFSFAEAQEKAELGMHILIREGSAARNFEALHPIIAQYPKQTMFCSDDKHPDDLLLGHINLLVKRALSLGYDFYDVWQAASVNPVKHYKLSVGLLQIGDLADFIVVDQDNDLNILETVINGEKIFPIIEDSSWPEFPLPNQFNISEKNNAEFELRLEQDAYLKVIEAIDGEIVTREIHQHIQAKDGLAQLPAEEDVLYISVVNRYNQAKPSIALVKGFGFKQGALASSVAHDSHNIVAVGSSPELLAAVVNTIIRNKGGVAITGKGEVVYAIPLPIAGLMSPLSVEDVGKSYQALNENAKSIGCKLKAPFMTLSFLALPVIPALKITDLGLFDVNQFKFTSLDVE